MFLADFFSFKDKTRLNHCGKISSITEQVMEERQEQKPGSSRCRVKSTLALSSKFQLQPQTNGARCQPGTAI